MRCGFCGDACCEHGVDVSVVERDRILAQASSLAPHLAANPSTWFDGPMEADVDFPGGAAVRTAVIDGRCVFLRRDVRGCVLHAVSLERGLDYHELKPMVSALFPVTFDKGVLLCADEIAENSLACAGSGPTVYEMARGELGYYFGDALVVELDKLTTVDAGLTTENKTRDRPLVTRD